MSRVRAALQTCLHSMSNHGCYAGSLQVHLYSMNVSKFKWNSFRTASSFNVAYNYKPLCLIKKEPCFLHSSLSLAAQISRRFYSSDSRIKSNDLQNAAPVDHMKEAVESTTDSMANEWSDVVNDGYQSVIGALFYTGKKAKEVSDGVNNYMQQIYDSHPYLENVIIPVGGTMTATLMAWFVMPKIFKKIHKLSSQNPLKLFSGGQIREDISYENSLWNALEDPARYLITFMAFYELGVVIAPTTSQYLPQVWRGAVVLSLVWFLHRWKSNVFTRAIEKRTVVGIDRDKLIALEKISSMGLLILGSIALAEACGVAVQSVLTVGGIGGVATAFAARDILGNILSGLSLQFSKPFLLGDNIKAGSIEGQVVDMGLTTTSLMNPEKFPVIVPNSLFSSQVIVNKSRARFRACIKTIPIQIDDLEKVPHITEEIKLMLCSYPRVSLEEKDAPYCYLARIDNSFLELSLGCYLNYLKKHELYAAEQSILLQAAAIIKKHGAKITCNLQGL